MRKTVKTITPALLLLAASALPAFAGAIEIIDPIAHFVEDSTNGDHIEIFMTINNTGSVEDRLYAVRTKVAKEAALNTLEQKAGHGSGGGHDEAQMTMAALAVPAGGEATLDEHGMHIMLTEPKRRYEAGETFTVTLFFEQAGRVTADVTVEEDEEGHGG